jgi:hypothetical protein
LSLSRIIKWEDTEADRTDFKNTYIEKAFEENEVEGGDHLIFIGKVLSYSYNTSEHTAPLFFWKGKYHSAADHVA